MPLASLCWFPPHRAGRPTQGDSSSTGTWRGAHSPNLLLLAVLHPCSGSSATLPPVDGKTSPRFGVRAALSPKERGLCLGNASLMSNMGFRSPWGTSLSLLPAAPAPKFLQTWHFYLSSPQCSLAEINHGMQLLLGERTDEQTNGWAYNLSFS